MFLLENKVIWSDKNNLIPDIRGIFFARNYVSSDVQQKKTRQYNLTNFVEILLTDFY